MHNYTVIQLGEPVHDLDWKPVHPSLAPRSLEPSFDLGARYAAHPRLHHATPAQKVDAARLEEGPPRRRTKELVLYQRPEESSGGSPQSSECSTYPSPESDAEDECGFKVGRKSS